MPNVGPDGCKVPQITTDRNILETFKWIAVSFPVLHKDKLLEFVYSLSFPLKFRQAGLRPILLKCIRKKL